MISVLYDNRWEGESGIGRYAREIVSRAPAEVCLRTINKGFKIKNPFSPLRLTAEIRRSRPDIFWSPGFMPPCPTGTPFIITMHDLIHLKHAGIERRLYYNMIIRPLCMRASRLITVSEYSRQLLLEWLKVEEWKVISIPNGVASCFKPFGDMESIGNPYVLYVGNRRTHKNLPRLLAAFGKSGINKDVVLAVSGGRDSELEQIAENAGIGRRLVFLNRLTDEQLARVYRGALAVALVSLSEGFGLPVVEAMACGTPVIASNIGALSEVANGAGLLVDPFDVEEIADGLSRIVNDSALRESLSDRGVERAKSFDWESSSSRTWDVIQKAAEK